MVGQSELRRANVRDACIRVGLDAARYCCACGPWQGGASLTRPALRSLCNPTPTLARRRGTFERCTLLSGACASSPGAGSPGRATNGRTKARTLFGNGQLIRKLASRRTCQARSTAWSCARARRSSLLQSPDRGIGRSDDCCW